jgi:PTH1 family peptidyl-tRNA hydrolase
MAKTIQKQNIFIVGLGNPGKQYYETPHSVGFMVVNEFAKRFEFGEFKMEPDGILTARKEIAGKTVILVKPQLFMNNSGKALAKLFAYLKIKRSKSYPNLWVINDDLDIPLGKIKIAKNRGSAGHRGVQSIIDVLKTKNFVRFRIGIAPTSTADKKIPADKFVLKKIAVKDQPAFACAIDTAVATLQTALSDGLDKAMTAYNK